MYGIHGGILMVGGLKHDKRLMTTQGYVIERTERGIGLKSRGREVVRVRGLIF